METFNLRMPVHTHPKSVRLSFIVYLQCIVIFFHHDMILRITVCLQCLGSFEQFSKSCEIKILNTLLTQLQCLVLAHLLSNKRTKLYFSSDFISVRDSHKWYTHVISEGSLGHLTSHYTALKFTLATMKGRRTSSAQFSCLGKHSSPLKHQFAVKRHRWGEPDSISPHVPFPLQSPHPFPSSSIKARAEQCRGALGIKPSFTQPSFFQGHQKQRTAPWTWTGSCPCPSKWQRCTCSREGAASHCATWGTAPPSCPALPSRPTLRALWGAEPCLWCCQDLSDIQMRPVALLFHRRSQLLRGLPQRSVKGEASLSLSLTLALRGALPAAPEAQTLRLPVPCPQPGCGMILHPGWRGRAVSLQPHPGYSRCCAARHGQDPAAPSRSPGRSRSPHDPAARPGSHVWPAPFPGPGLPPPSHLLGRAFTTRFGRVGRAANNITTLLWSIRTNYPS